MAVAKVASGSSGVAPGRDDVVRAPRVRTLPRLPPRYPPRPLSLEHSLLPAAGRQRAVRG